MCKRASIIKPDMDLQGLLQHCIKNGGKEHYDSFTKAVRTDMKFASANAHLFTVASSKIRGAGRGLFSKQEIKSGSKIGLTMSALTNDAVPLDQLDLTADG